MDKPETEYNNNITVDWRNKDYSDEYSENKQNGGLFGLGGDSFEKAIKATKKSETMLIKSYSEMDKTIKKYHKIWMIIQI
jgi:hypothetical protein